MKYVIEWYRKDLGRFLYSVESSKTEATEFANYLVTESANVEDVTDVKVTSTTYNGQHCNESCLDDCHHVLIASTEGGVLVA